MVSLFGLLLACSMSFGSRASVMLLSFFFFSSRRRHTRSLCDWSSDVCSSDLGVRAVVLREPRVPEPHVRLTVARVDTKDVFERRLQRIARQLARGDLRDARRDVDRKSVV